jgi:polysaccharide export outer membrane protein
VRAAALACALALPVLYAQQPAAEYVLGPGDQVLVRALDVDEIGDKPALIDGQGYIKLPLAGRIRAASLTVEQLEAAITKELKLYVLDPQVTVSIAEYRSQPVSVLGAVGSPGVQQLQGRKTLFEVLSLAGGLRADAGHSIKITRQKGWGAVPLAGAVWDATGEFSVATVSVVSVMDARNPRENILICPYDVISVPRADMVYVIGSVKRAGGFVLNEKEHMSVLQALSLAEGLEITAAVRSARILRTVSGGAPRAEVAIDLRGIMQGRSRDVPLNAGDILFVPSSKAKSVSLRALEAALQIGTGIAIWRR